MYKGQVQGWVYDDSLKSPLSTVKVYANEIPDTMYTNDSGRFYFSRIDMPRSEHNYYFNFQRYGYENKQVSVLLNNVNVVRIDSILLHKTL